MSGLFQGVLDFFDMYGPEYLHGHHLYAVFPGKFKDPGQT